MKTKIITLFVILFSAYLSLNAQVILTENFSYPAGDSIGAHGWTGVSGTTNNILVKSPGLTFATYLLSNIGNCARLSNNGMDNVKTTTGDSVTSGNFYTSFMVKVDSAKGTGDYFLALLPPSSNTSYFGRVFAKDTLGGLCFGVSKYSISATILPTWGTTTFSYGTTYLVVVKYKFNSAAADDEVSLFVFSGAIPTTEPTTPYAGPVVNTQADAASLGKVALRQGSAAIAPSLDIDGIQVFKSWSNIVNVQNISSVADKFSLAQNYPNPFNPETNINFSIPSNGFVNMRVYNALGQEVKSLVSDNLTAGTYNARFSGANLTSGVYYCKIEFTSNEGKFFTDMKKLVLVK